MRLNDWSAWLDWWPSRTVNIHLTSGSREFVLALFCSCIFFSWIIPCWEDLLPHPQHFSYFTNIIHTDIRNAVQMNRYQDSLLRRAVQKDHLSSRWQFHIWKILYMINHVVWKNKQKYDSLDSRVQALILPSCHSMVKIVIITVNINISIRKHTRSATNNMRDNIPISTYMSNLCVCKREREITF